MRNCFLHVGTHKTGTSALQRVLAEHPQKLAEAGYYFPRTGRLTADSGQHALAAISPSEQHDALLAALMSEIATCGDADVIVSSEEFSRMLWHNPDGLQALVFRLNAVFDRVVVVMYLRRQADFIESNYIERLKSRLYLDFASYARIRLRQDFSEFPLDYARWIERLDGMQGFELCVRSYDAVRETSVLRDFQQIIGWPDSIVLPDSRDNTSSDLVEPLKQFCRAQEQRMLSRAEEWVIELIASGFKKRPQMDVNTRRTIVSHFNSGNVVLAQRFNLPQLLEALPAERDLGAWKGQDALPPPDLASIPDATLDQLFSRSFSVMVRTLGERVAALNVALAEVQTLASARQNENDRLRLRVTALEVEANSTPNVALRTGVKLRSLPSIGQSRSRQIGRWRAFGMFLIVLLTALLPTFASSSMPDDFARGDSDQKTPR